MQSTFCENYYKGDDGKTLSTQLPCTLNGIKGVDDSIGISWAEGKEGFMEILAFKEGGMLYVSDTDNPSDIKEGSYKVTKEGLKVTYPFEGELEDILIPINPLFSWQR